MTRDLGAIVSPAVDVDQLAKDCRALQYKIADTERRIERDAEQVKRWELEQGEMLVRARKAWPARGPKAAGWGRFIADIGISQPTAFRRMELVGYVAEREAAGDFIHNPSAVNEIGYREAGIDTRPRKSDAPVEPTPLVADVPPDDEEDDEEDDGPPTAEGMDRIDRELAIEAMERARSRAVEPISNERREAAYRRETLASLPPSMAVREKATHAVVELAATLRAASTRFEEMGIHLTDVTTSPEDFMRAKQMLIDTVNRCLDELANAGVLDGKEQRRQLSLLKGGVQ